MRISVPVSVACVAGVLLAGCSPAEEGPPTREAEPLAEPAAISESVEAPAEPPESLVRTLYGEDSIPFTPAQIRRFFTEEFVPGLTPDPGEEPLIDFDYRFDAQDAEITGFALSEIAAGPEGSRIEAQFRNFGQPMRVAYDLCRRDNGEWRIQNVEGVSNGWNLRAILSLPATPPPGC